MVAVCATSHRHTTSVAQQDGLATDRSWTDDGTRRQIGEPYDILHGMIDGEKKANRAGFLIQCQEWMVHVEQPAQENIV